MTTSAVSAGAASTTLALAVGLGSSRKLHDNSGDKALLSIDYVSSVAAALLHALALVSAVAVSAGARHGGGLT